MPGGMPQLRGTRRGGRRRSEGVRAHDSEPIERTSCNGYPHPNPLPEGEGDAQHGLVVELRDRLQRALSNAGGGGRQAPALRRAPPGESRIDGRQDLGQREPGIEAFLPGFWQDTPAGRVFVVERRYELDYQHGAYALGRVLDVPPEIMA